MPRSGNSRKNGLYPLKLFLHRSCPRPLFNIPFGGHDGGGDERGGEQSLDLTERPPEKLFGAPNQQHHLKLVLHVQLSRISVHNPLITMGSDILKRKSSKIAAVGSNADTFQQIPPFHMCARYCRTTETPEEGTLRESW